MPRRNLQFVQRQYYHIYNRGAARQSIFREEQNYVYVLKQLKQVTSECCVTVIAYCLMPNHYHWLVRQDSEVSAAMVPKRVFGSYSQAFNKAYEHSGTLFEGPFKAIHVDSDEYLYHLCRYIHANPVRHSIAMLPELWPYSNYLEWIGKRKGTLVDRTFVQARFKRPADYEAYVASYIFGRVKLPPRLKEYMEELEAGGSGGDVVYRSPI